MRSKFLAFLSYPVYEQVLKRGSRFLSITQGEKIKAFQLDRFNEVWLDAWTELPFYRQWKENNHLPEQIKDLRELKEWPILRKLDLQKAGPALLRERKKPNYYVKTGGSTGEPLCLGSWPDGGVASSSQWLGRAAYGYYPGMRTFLLWGHEHLYGKGLRRSINILQRKVKDWVSNICRVSAYDLTAEAMERAFDRFFLYNPDCVIGFSAAVLAFCRVNMARGRRVVNPPRFVLCTAGPLSNSEKAEIEAFYRAKVCMEYGSVECSVMGYTNPGLTGYCVFWDTHLIQSLSDENGERRNIVTRLSPCYVPLIRYDIGDLIDVAEKEEDSHLILKDVKGRPSDIVRLSNGTAFFGALIGDCVKQVEGILSNQIFVYANGIKINITTSRMLLKEDFALIRSRLETVVPGLRSEKLLIECLPALRMTVGGKIPLVVHCEDETL